ncbi:uncharacterized protein LOC9631711 [Selaginella moellendorffii]|uniref:uncharacterized protein LOC9631711 n=1 Tax=Selaginella moellendorffii TaxID=88036 RepID=UPI000D1C53D4|nr:uncharacterized protein LOC9631711 [Selaginella moellendorffii]|eukprot:XP_024527671.1 uncharacterized protein LOC9631711 [Selaginella moellendorffii]
MGKATFMKGKMLAKALQAVEAGWIPEQVWMKAARRMQEEPLVTKKTKKERQPEDAFIESFLTRHPESEFIALDVTSSDHPASLFASRQMEVMKAFGLKRNPWHKRLAREIVEAELTLQERLRDQCLSEERIKAFQEGRRGPPVKKTALQKAHEEALRHHLAGMKKMKRQYEAGSVDCTIPFKDAFAEAKRWDERDQGGMWSDAFSQGPGRRI